MLPPFRKKPDCCFSKKTKELIFNMVQLLKTFPNTFIDVLSFKKNQFLNIIINVLDKSGQLILLFELVIINNKNNEKVKNIHLLSIGFGSVKTYILKN